MVCRENKGRSAFMAVTKHLLRQAGFQSYADFETQSIVHDLSHHYAGAPQPSLEEQITILKGFRQTVINDDSLSDEAKHRPATGKRGQTGIVTRIDQELTRLATGTDEQGRPLKPAQINKGSNLLAISRMAEPLARMQHAKEAYFELYARHTGCTVDQARTKFNQLVNEPLESRDDTRISLRDGWKDRLEVAGFTSQQQADIGQSNQTRYALKVMELERTSHVRSLPSRPALRPEHVREVLHPDDPRAQKQCVGGCGQFGHTPNECPNAAQVAAHQAADQAYQQAAATYAVQSRAVDAKRDLADLAAGQQVSNVDADGQRRWPQINSDTLDPADPAVQQTLTEQAAPFSVRKHRAAKKAAAETQQEYVATREALEEARGPIPPQSSYLEQMAYNPESNVLHVTTRGYVKKDGTQMPPKTYVYRMPQDEYDQLMAQPDIGHAVSTTLFARKGVSDAWKFENAADLAEAEQERRCPSCGRWASMNSTHQCPVDGSGTEEENFRHAETLRKAKEENRLRGLPAPAAASVPRKVIPTPRQYRLPGAGGVLRVPDPRQVQAAMQPSQVGHRKIPGGIAIGEFSVHRHGETVTGRVQVWREQGSANTLYRVDKVKCSCGQRPPCEHATAAARIAGRPFQGQLTEGTAGGRDFSRPQEVAQEHYDAAPRLSYERIRSRQAAQIAQIQRRAVGDPSRSPFVSGPVDAETGKPVSPHEIPKQWRADRDTPLVDLDNPGQVAGHLRDLPTIQRANAKVTVDSGGGVWVRPAVPTTQSMRNLRAAFGLPSETGTRGVYIPADRGWRSEMLDRVYGRKPRWRGSPVIQPITTHA